MTKKPLREQVREILPDILPKRSVDAIRAKELAKLIPFPIKLTTLSFILSTLAKESAPIITRYAGSKGYYLSSSRPAELSVGELEALKNREKLLGDILYDAAELLADKQPVTMGFLRRLTEIGVRAQAALEEVAP